MTQDFSDMEKRQLKIATQELLDEFDNLHDAAKQCRMSTARLSQFQNFDAPAFMPIDVVFALERQVGKPVVTSQISKMHGAYWPEPEGDAASEAMDLSPAVGDLVSFIKQATQKESPGGVKFTENEKRAYLKIRAHMDKELRELDLAVERDQHLPSWPFPVL